MAAKEFVLAKVLSIKSWGKHFDDSFCSLIGSSFLKLQFDTLHLALLLTFYNMLKHYTTTSM